MKMKTERLHRQDMNRVVELLQAGKIVALPSDTVFGLAISINHIETIDRLKEVKHRQDDRPFPVLVSSKSQINQLALLSRRDVKLVRHWMPGAMTLIVNKAQGVDSRVTSGKGTIAIRMPDDPWLIELIRKVGYPLLMPSANITGEKEARSSDEVLAYFDGLIEGVVEGESLLDVSSTVIDASSKKLVEVRKGPISLNEVKKSLLQGGNMKIALAADHGGYQYKEILKQKLDEWGYEVEDFGTHSEDSMDYSDVVYPAAKAVSEGRCDRGIIFCGTGIGASITANKVHGIRCALVNDVAVAEVTRLHNDSNVLAMGGRVISEETMVQISKTWLDTLFSEDERHQRRIDKIAAIEKLEE